MVESRPHKATLSWISGGNYDTGRLSGGVSHTLDIRCRIVDVVGELSLGDGRKLSVKNKVFLDSMDLSAVNEESLQITFNGTTHKVLRASRRQSHIKLWL